MPAFVENCERYLNTSLQFLNSAYLALVLKRLRTSSEVCLLPDFWEVPRILILYQAQLALYGRAILRRVAR